VPVENTKESVIVVLFVIVVGMEVTEKKYVEIGRTH